MLPARGGHVGSAGKLTGRGIEQFRARERDLGLIKGESARHEHLTVAEQFRDVEI